VHINRLKIAHIRAPDPAHCLAPSHTESNDTEADHRSISPGAVVLKLISLVLSWIAVKSTSTERFVRVHRLTVQGTEKSYHSHTESNDTEETQSDNSSANNQDIHVPKKSTNNEQPMWRSNRNIIKPVRFRDDYTSSCSDHRSISPGADPGFQVGGGAHLKKLRRAEGGANIFGVFRVKNHIFFNFRGGGAPESLSFFIIHGAVVDVIAW
jgi:hypothetical protein